MTSPDKSAAPIVTDAAHTTTFLLDVEHTGYRLFLPLVTLAAFILTYVLINSIPDPAAQAYLGCLAFVAAIGMALLAAVLTERFLRRTWKSGKSLLVSADRLTLHQQRSQPRDITFDLEKRINPLTWRFVVRRGSAHVQRGWYMLGLQLLQDETPLILYTFMPPKEAEALPSFERFTALIPRHVVDRGDFPVREVAQQRRLLAAEDKRWHTGLEVQQRDFPILLDLLRPYIEDWQN